MKSQSVMRDFEKKKFNHTQRMTIDSRNYDIESVQSSMFSIDRVTENDKRTLNRIYFLELKLKFMESNFKKFKAQVLNQITQIKGTLGFSQEQPEYYCDNKHEYECFFTEKNRQYGQSLKINEENSFSQIFDYQVGPIKLEKQEQSKKKSTKQKIYLDQLSETVNAVNISQKIKYEEGQRMNFSRESDEGKHKTEVKVKMPRFKNKRWNTLETYIQEHLDGKITFTKLKHILKVNTQKTMQRIQKYKNQQAFRRQLVQ